MATGKVNRLGACPWSSESGGQRCFGCLREGGKEHHIVCTQARKGTHISPTCVLTRWWYRPPMAISSSCVPVSTT